jgi:pimeloyl-ACP methyl ester carboxylesterase
MKNRLIGLICLFISVSAKAENQYEWFTQSIDHQSSATFQQRYLVNSDYAKSNDAPVLYFLSPSELLKNCFEKYITKEIASQLGMRFVALEHRFYGESQPFGLLTNKNLKYLNLDYALKDFAVFQRFMQSTRGWTGPWIVIGASYSGALAAYYRLSYPELADGAVSSCASVKRHLNADIYDRIAADVAGKDCVAKYRKSVLRPIEKAVKKPKELLRIKKLFMAEDIKGADAFLGYIGLNADYYVQMRGAGDFCKAVSSPDPVSAFAALLNNFNVEVVRKAPLAWTPQGFADPDVNRYKIALGARQWNYQICTELGNFGVKYADSSRSLHSNLSREWTGWKGQCAIFEVHAPPAIEEINKRFYQGLLQPTTSRILFLNNANDPINMGAISAENRNNTNPNTVSYTIPNSAHCAEFRASKADDSASVVKARVLILDTVKNWLKPKAD